MCLSSFSGTPCGDNSPPRAAQPFPGKILFGGSGRQSISRRSPFGGGDRHVLDPSEDRRMTSSPALDWSDRSCSAQLLSNEHTLAAEKSSKAFRAGGSSIVCQIQTRSASKQQTNQQPAAFLCSTAIDCSWPEGCSTGVAGLADGCGGCAPVLLLWSKYRSGRPDFFSIFVI